MRGVVLGAALLFVLLLLGLTVHATARRGIDVFTVLSVFILTVVVVGVGGALLNRPHR